MLNWIKFLVVFLLSLTAVLVVVIFYNAYKPISATNSVAAEKAIQSGKVTVVDHTEIYNGTDSFVTVFGTNEAGDEVAIFVDEASDEDYKEVNLKDGITAKKAEQLVKEDLEVGKILHVSLGIEAEGPVWEVAFKNKNDKLNYVYLLFEDGHWWKKILNL